jgi:hypothetical protein
MHIHMHSTYKCYICMAHNYLWSTKWCLDINGTYIRYIHVAHERWHINIVKIYGTSLWHIHIHGTYTYVGHTYGAYIWNIHL